MPYCYDCPGIKGKDTDVEPEMDSDPTVEGDGSFEFVVRLVNNCEEGHELEEAELEFSGDFDPAEHLPDEEDEHGEAQDAGDHEFSIAVELERDERAVTTKRRTLKSGEVKVTPVPYRYQRKFYTVSAHVTVTCKCGETVYDETLYEEVQASGMSPMR